MSSSSFASSFMNAFKGLEKLAGGITKDALKLANGAQHLKDSLKPGSKTSKDGSKVTVVTTTTQSSKAKGPKETAAKKPSPDKGLVVTKKAAPSPIKAVCANKAAPAPIKAVCAKKACYANKPGAKCK